jgi:uncharacterized protein
MIDLTVNENDSQTRSHYKAWRIVATRHRADRAKEITVSRQHRTPPRIPPRIAPRISGGALRAAGRDGLAAALAGPPEEAAPWLAAAARYGLVEAQVALGQCLLDGRGMAADPEAAMRWFTIAAQAGHPPAMNMLGRCLERGWGCAADHVEAGRWYARAAALGLDWAQYNLANALLRGRGVPRDRVAAFAWFRRAAAQGHAKSLNLVGRFLDEGWEIPPDPAAAAQCYRRAAEGGDYRGAYNWATCLARAGREAEAARWFRRAAAEATPDLLEAMVQTLASMPAFSDAWCLARARLAEAGSAVPA